VYLGELSTKTQKFRTLDHLSGHDRMGKKTSHTTVPLSTDKPSYELDQEKAMKAKPFLLR
jgi:hypothetical protein